MEFDNYNEVIFCASPEVACVLLKESSFSSQAIGIAIRSRTDADELILQQQSIFHTNTARFCMFLDAATIRDEIQIPEHIAVFLYHPKYLFRNTKAVIYLVDNPTAIESNFDNKIAESISALGFEVQIQHLASWNDLEDNEYKGGFQFVSTSEPDVLKATYKQYLLSNALVDRTIIVHVKYQRHALEILQAIKTAEAEFKADNSHLHNLFQRYRQLSQNAAMLGAANKQLEIDLKNQQKYLAVLRNEKEMEKIVEFYHREYEVLPLWYKRFGHIIKFITGKRKLRSNQKQE